MFLKLILILSVLTVFATVPQAEGATDKVVCYFASWARYRTDADSYTPADINPKLCTHIVYAFLGVGSEGFIQYLDDYNDIRLNTLQDVADLKTINPDLKVLFGIGGWNAGHELLANVVASDEYRFNFIKSCLSIFEQFNYDGVDVDWEFPYDDDMDNYIKLLQEIRAAFYQKGYILSVSVPYTAVPSYISQAHYNVPEISKAADIINVLTYNLFTGNYATHNSALYGLRSVNSSVSEWVDKGADPNKLIFSIPFYGQIFSLNDTQKNEVGAYAKWEQMQIPYNHFCSLNGYTFVWDDQAQVPYAYSGGSWITYDDARSVTAKVNYAKAKDFAGVAIWSIDYDDFGGACGIPNILLQAVDQAMY